MIGPTVPKRTPAPGDILAGDYRVEGVLGAGGMGTVFAVVRVESGEALAMKVVGDASDQEHVARFFREGRATIRIASEHVVRVLDVGTIDGVIPYMVMERLTGSTLKALLQEQGPLDDRTLADLMIQACEGLAHAHSAGIVHRDIKPSNLFVSTASHGPLLKILDFGISKVASREEWERTTTESGAFLGSPYYVSPEQLKNASRIDARADIWSLGVTMYNALSLKFPFEGGSLAELLVGVISGTATPLSTRSRASAAMLAVVDRCMERNLDRRFRDVGEVALALAPIASPRWAAIAPQVATLAKRATAPTVLDPASTMTFDEPPVLPKLPQEVTLALPAATGSRSLGSTAPPASVVPERPRASRRTLALALGGGLALAVLGGIAVAATVRSSSPAAGNPTTTSASVAMTTTSPAASRVAEPASSLASPRSDDVAAPSTITLELSVRGGSITKVIHPSARRVSLEDGKALVTVPPFRGELPIDVEVGGKSLAHGVAHEGGPKTIALTMVKGPVVRPTGTKTRGSSELHSDPYE